MEKVEIKNPQENKVLKIIDVAVFWLSVAVFAFCLVYSVIGWIMKWESPINGYGVYGSFEVLERAGALALIFVPFVLRKLHVVIPRAATIGYNVFILICVFGGTFMGLYINTHWWDKFNHTLSGVLLGIAGLFFTNLLTKNAEKVSPFGVFVMVFAFAVMCGAVWEIYEYACDGIIGGTSNMQKFMDDHTLVQYIGRDALADTMGDLIVDSLGGFVTGLVSAFIVRRDRDFLRMFAITLDKPAA